LRAQDKNISRHIAESRLNGHLGHDRARPAGPYSAQPTARQLPAARGSVACQFIGELPISL
jgi:hypothetical protein